MFRRNTILEAYCCLKPLDEPLVTDGARRTMLLFCLQLLLCVRFLIAAARPTSRLQPAYRDHQRMLLSDSRTIKAAEHLESRGGSVGVAFTVVNDRHEEEVVHLWFPLGYELSTCK